MMMNNKLILAKLDEMIPNPKCELNYTKDYELLIAIILSAQTLDSRVNQVTKILWQNYNLETLANANIEDIEKIIKPIGTYHNKAKYIINVAKRLIKEQNGIVPNDSNYIESLPGVGHKTCNVFLSNIYDVPRIAVDTHVARTSKRLGFVNGDDDVLTIEHKLMKIIPKNEWSRRHHQLVLFGRYTCKAKNPNCSECLLNKLCQYKRKN